MNWCVFVVYVSVCFGFVSVFLSFMVRVCGLLGGIKVLVVLLMMILGMFLIVVVMIGLVVVIVLVEVILL